MSRSRLKPTEIARLLVALVLTTGAAAAGNAVSPAAAPAVSNKADAPDDRIVELAVAGTDFRVRLASGRVLSGRDLVGAELEVVLVGESSPQTVLVDAVSNDPLDPSGETLIYKMRALDPETGRWEELCNPDAAGERWAFPLRGQWDEDGHPVSDQGFTLTCADGSLGKCVRWGYKPWKTLPDGTRLAEYHQACVRMVNANYCGDNRTTRDGMLIDYWDDLGIATADPDPQRMGLTFEAAWGPNGAICVAHTRVPEHETLDGLRLDCPRLAGRLGPQQCTAETAANGEERALLFNRSR